MVVVTTFAILSTMGLPITLNLCTVNLPVLISTSNPLTTSLVLRAAPGERVNNTSSILERRLSLWEGLPEGHTQGPSWDENPDVLTPVPVLFLLCQSLGYSCLVASQVCWTSEALKWRKPGLGGCSGRGRVLWGCFSPDVGSEELRLLLTVHPMPHSQLPAHRLFLFCCELQFPWAPH